VIKDLNGETNQAHFQTSTI